MAKKKNVKSKKDLKKHKIISPLDIINCPKCGESIPINATLQHQLKENIKGEMQKEFDSQEKELEKQKKELVNEKRNIDNKVNKKLEQERSKLEKDAIINAKDVMSKQVKDLENQLNSKSKRLEEAQEQELCVRQEKRDLEERQKAFELEMTRKIDEEREKIIEAAKKTVLEENHFKELEKDKKLNDALKQVEELKIKLQQGSQQTQGEVVELELEELLKSQFPLDNIDPVCKGIKGADVIQNVHTKSGHFCGRILWELKNHKKWSKSWISKLKDDQRVANADVAVLISTTLPKEISTFDFKNGIWIANFGSAIGLATALRMGIIQIAATKSFAEGKNEKMEILYNYLSGPEFKNKIEAIVESFKSMQDDLNEEKRMFAKKWAKREKEIEKIIYTTATLYGDMQGLIGTSIKPIPLLEYNEKKVSKKTRRKRER